MKEVIATEVIAQQKGNTIFITVPATVRSILKPIKGQLFEFIIYDDKSIGLRMKEEK